jgi:creatinine amidohydrolase
MSRTVTLLVTAVAAVVAAVMAPRRLHAQSQTNPLWTEQKVKNYLPHMTWPEVEELVSRTDMVIIPIGSLEQHGYHLPIGTDSLDGIERAKLIAQRVDALVAPILLAGNSPYHMEFPGTITLSLETIERVYVEAAQSLLRHGFRRFLILNSHGGNAIVSRFIADRINHETAGIAVELGEAAAPFLEREAPEEPRKFDRHGGVGETSSALYYIPSLVKLDAAVKAKLSMPDHMEAMLPAVIAGDPTAMRVFLAEGLKAKETGKHTSAREMSTTGVWSERDPREATVERGRKEAEAFVEAAVRFIERWNELRPLEPVGSR